MIDIKEDLVLMFEHEKLVNCNETFFSFFNCDNLVSFERKYKDIVNCFIKKEKEDFIDIRTKHWLLDLKNNKINYKVAMLNESGKKRYFYVKLKEYSTIFTTIILKDITEIFIEEEIKRDKEIKEKLRLGKHIELLEENVILSMTDTKGKITFASKKFSKVSGYSMEELVGQQHSIVKHPDTDENIYKCMWGRLTKGESWKGVISNKGKNGNKYWVDGTIIPNHNENGKLIGYTGVRYDITAQKEMEVKLIKDELTEIYNRKYYNEKIKELLMDKRGNFGLFILDIDNFKKYNDTYGHKKGDEILIKVAKKLESSLRETDCICRIGGEEFVILLKNISEKVFEEKGDFFNQLIYEENLKHVKNIDNRVTVSIGGVLLKKTKETVDEKTLFEIADKLLYQIKKEGRNNNKIVVL